ncbi:Uncharacterised protein [Phocoenobacter uteri]|uniref:Lipoprotein n=1 Tax=Phocoenobacter uteri TaxID=146806 RepID=A0A379CA68_9PAST|nr:hypothetical protein [Phocoenobacter uteri]MDG6881139.1 hypothetical protein [Phocoenobacter uteri]SUB59161.1 Uncharacterised protein [Phocoenobacter uteri]
MKRYLLLNILLNILLLQGCSAVKFWNGYYSVQSAHREAEKKRKIYYDKEAPEQKELRKKNRLICRELANKIENRIPEKGFPNGVWNERLFVHCMKERGTPEF